MVFVRFMRAFQRLSAAVASPLARIAGSVGFSGHPRLSMTYRITVGLAAEPGPSVTIGEMTRRIPNFTPGDLLSLDRGLRHGITRGNNRAMSWSRQIAAQRPLLRVCNC
jgi:hypothetical protein